MIKTFTANIFLSVFIYFRFLPNVFSINLIFIGKIINTKGEVVLCLHVQISIRPRRGNKKNVG